jgi:hypothetical protein
MLDSAVDQCLEGLLATVQPGIGSRSSDDQFRFDEDFYAPEDNSVPLGVSMTWEHDLPATEVPCWDTNTFDLDLKPVSAATAVKFDGLDDDALKPSTCNLCKGKTCSAGAVLLTNLPHVGTSRGSANCIQSGSLMQTNLCMPPPSLPTNPCFRLEPTTLRLRGAVACDLWRCLVLFFEAQATITKKTPMKHAINADVWLDAVRCSLKVRTYAGENGTFAVQVQRRHGDSVCFSHIFLHFFKHIAEQPAAGSMEPCVAVM